MMLLVYYELVQTQQNYYSSKEFRLTGEIIRERNALSTLYRRIQDISYEMGGHFFAHRHYFQNSCSFQKMGITFNAKFHKLQILD